MELTVFWEAIAAWQTFYFTLAGVSATLTGLLFVAVSLHLQQFTDPAHPELQTLAYKTFTTLINLLLYAFFFLVPRPDPVVLAGLLALTALIALFALGRQTPGFGRMVLHTWGRPFFLWRVLLPGACHVLVLGVTLTLPGQTTFLPLLPGALLILLVVTMRNAWDLLVRVGADARASRGRRGDDPQLERLEQQLREVTRRQRQITRQQEEAGRDLFPPTPRRRG